MYEIYFVATRPDFNKAVGISHEGIVFPLIFTDDLMYVACNHKEKLNAKYNTNSFRVYKATVDSIKERA